MTRRLLLTAILLLALFPAQSLAGEPRIFSGVELSVLSAATLSLKTLFKNALI